MNAHTAMVLDYSFIQGELQTYTVTPMGKALAEKLQPHTDATLIAAQLAETSEMLALLVTHDEPPLAAVVDIHPHLASAQITGFYLEGPQLLDVANCLEVLQQLRRYLQRDAARAPLLSRRLAPLADFSIFLRQLRHALDDKGQVRDHASPTLQNIRQTLTHTRERIHRSLRELMATHSAIVQDPVVTIRNGRFVIPLKTDFRQVLRGIVHGESASGATVYVEPDSAVDLNNLLLHTQAEEERAVREVLRELTERLAVQRVALEQALQLLGEADFLVGKGRLSQRMQGTAPRLTQERAVRLLDARHPLLRDPLPINICLGPEAHTLVITGPNTGGKTAALKTIGLLCLMVQSGLHIPVHPDSTVPIFSDIFVDIGDEQSLQQSLSTFSAHVTNLRQITVQVSAQCLLLLDELGAGTDPMEGGPLGVAILEYFHQRGPMTFVTTHHSLIKAYAMATPQIACASVDFDLETLQPRYQLLYGLPGRSKAFVIAEKLGLPEDIIKRAQQEAGMTQIRSEALIARLEEERQVIFAERQQLDHERRESARLHAEAQETLARAVAAEQQIRQTLYDEGQALLKTARQEVDTTLAVLRRQAVTGETVDFPHEAWQHVIRTITTLAPPVSTSPEPAAVQVGDYVRIRHLNIVGRLRTSLAEHHTVQVEVGTKTLTVAASEIERADSAASTDTTAPARSSRRRPRHPEAADEPVSETLHVRGATVAEALPMVEQYLNQAFMQGIPRVRIIHGIGSGRLRDSIAELLGKHPLVRRFQAGDANGGTTIVELEG